jgi:endonuclease/exonuclease/phosphatase family metal-dependent hydrolase
VSFPKTPRLAAAFASVCLTACATVDDRDAGPDADAVDADVVDADDAETAGLRCATQWPLESTAIVGRPTPMLYARVWLEGLTPSGGLDPALAVEVGCGPAADDPAAASWAWAPAAHNPSCLGCTDEDEFMGTVTPPVEGALIWAARARYGDDPAVLCDRADEGRAGSDDGWSPADAPTLAVEAPASLGVVSLNLRCLLDDWDLRRPLIVEAIAAAAPDLIGFEEACEEPGGRDNLTELVDALEARTGLDYEITRTVTHVAWDLYDEGIAIVTPHHIVEHDEADLPVGAFPRKVLLTRIDAPAETVTFASTHLDNLDGTVRADQADALVAAIGAFAPAGETIVLTGDFNEGPDGEVHPILTGTGFVDLWEELHPGEPGFTFPATDPTIRIDYVWTLAGETGLAPAAIERILADVVDGVTGSDHLGLSAVLEE